MNKTKTFLLFLSAVVSLFAQGVTGRIHGTLKYPTKAWRDCSGST
jgi:hypothetical protein